MTTPPKAVTAEAWPDGNALVLSSASGFCHAGRSRPTRSLIAVVASGVTIITPTVKSAARW